MSQNDNQPSDYIELPLLPTDNEPTDDPIFTACMNENWNAVKLYLERRGNSMSFFSQRNSSDDNKTILHYACAISKDQDDVATDMVYTIFKKMDRIEYTDSELYELVNLQTSDTGTAPMYTALHYAIDGEHKRVVEKLMLNAADVNIRAKNGKKDALGLIYDRLHVVMLKLFDNGYAVVKDEYEPSDEQLWKIHCNFISIAGVCTGNPPRSGNSPNEKYRETSLLSEVLQRRSVDTTRIILHPLVQIFLYEKGKKMKWFIWFSMFYHMLWSVLVSIYLGCNFEVINKSDHDGGISNFTAEESGPNSSLRANSSSDTSYCGSYFGTNIFTWPFFWCILVMWIVATVKEAFEFYICPSKIFYITQMENVGQLLVLLVLLVSTIVKIIGCEANADNTFCREFIFILKAIGIPVAILLIQGQLTKQETLGIYIHMFAKILVKFFKFLTAFLALLAAFFVSFILAFPEKKYQFFYKWIPGLNKLLSMMTGELNHDELFDKENSSGQSTDRLVVAVIVFFLFVVCVSILLNNLLVALTISDIEKLKIQGLTRHLEARLEVIYMAEQILTNDFLTRRLVPWKCYKNFLNSRLVQTPYSDSTTDDGNVPVKIKIQDLPQWTKNGILKRELGNIV